MANSGPVAVLFTLCYYYKIRITIQSPISISLTLHLDVAFRYMKFQKNPNDNIGLGDLVVISKPGLAVVSAKITD